MITYGLGLVSYSVVASVHTCMTLKYIKQINFNNIIYIQHCVIILFSVSKAVFVKSLRHLQTPIYHAIFRTQAMSRHLVSQILLFLETNPASKKLHPRH